MNKKWIALLLMLAMILVGAAAMAADEHYCDMKPVEGEQCLVKCECGETAYWHSYDEENPGICTVCNTPCEHEFNGTARCINCYYYLCPHEEIDSSKICEQCSCTIYIVTYDPGEGSGTPITEKIVYKNNASYLLPECTFTAPENGTFVGWNVNGVTKKVGAWFDAVDGMTITAVWEVEVPKIKVTFVANNDIDEEPYITEIEQGTKTMLPPPEMWNFSNKANHTFEGWNDGEKTYTPSEEYEFTTIDVTLTAVWTPGETADVCNLTFDYNGALDAWEDTGTVFANIEIGSKWNLPTQQELADDNGDYRVIIPDGWTLKEWDVDGTKRPIGYEVEVVEGLVITAIWNMPAAVTKYTVTFDANGGTGSMTAASVEEGAQYTLPSCGFTATMDGDKIREFDAWEVDGVTYQPGDKLPAATGDITVKATWKYAEQTKVVPAAIDSIPQEVLDEMPEDLNTAEEIIVRMEEIAQEAGFEEKNIQLFDVKLMVLNENGEWREATEEEAQRGIRVVFDIPDGTNPADHEYVVTHMFMTGDRKGQIETPEVTIVNNQIVVVFHGLSPVSIAWKVKPNVPASDLPQTGDPSSLMAWVTLLGASGLGMKAVRRRKK